MKRDGVYPPPYSLRLTHEERALLDQLAGTMSISAYIRMQIFGVPSPRKRNLRRTRADEEALAEALSILGRSKISNNLNQLAKAVHSGSLSITPDTEDQLRQACRDIEVMRGMLIEALGLKDDTP
tara:strand:- start:151 stop:525 length:375 start_codon:yes stop_codon:yes gene_type:complete